MLSSAIPLFSWDPFPPWWDLVCVCTHRSLPHSHATFGEIRYACVFCFGHFGAPQSAPWRECLYLVAITMFCVFFTVVSNGAFKSRLIKRFYVLDFLIFFSGGGMSLPVFLYFLLVIDRIHKSRQGRIADVRIFSCLHYSRLLLLFN